jgi:hypothetical protein
VWFLYIFKNDWIYPHNFPEFKNICIYSIKFPYWSLSYQMAWKLLKSKISREIVTFSLNRKQNAGSVLDSCPFRNTRANKGKIPIVQATRSRREREYYFTSRSGVRAKDQWWSSWISCPILRVARWFGSDRCRSIKWRRTWVLREMRW